MIQLIKDGKLFTEQDFLNAHPNVSFPQPIPYAEHGYDIVFSAPPPAYDPATQFARKVAPVLTTKGHYETQWEVVALDADTIAANQAVAKALDKAQAQADLDALDLKSIRALREYVAAQANAPQFVKDNDAAAVKLRARLK